MSDAPLQETYMDPFLDLAVAILMGMGHRRKFLVPPLLSLNLHLPLVSYIDLVPPSISPPVSPCTSPPSSLKPVSYQPPYLCLVGQDDGDDGEYLEG